MSLIDREDALDLIFNWKAKEPWDEFNQQVAFEIIHAMPSAQPESCGDVISKEYLKEHIEACWINGRPRYEPELNEVLSWIDDVPSAQPERASSKQVTGKLDLISRQAAIDKFERWLKVEGYSEGELNMLKAVLYELRFIPSAQPEIIRCKDCKFGEQDEVGRWFCRSLGCQIGNEDGSGFCADAERRTDNANIDT